MASLLTVAAAAAAVMSVLLIWPMSAQDQGQGVADKSGVLLVKPSEEEAITYDEVKQEIIERENEGVEFYMSGNFVGLCNELYTEDCVLYLPDHTIARGKEECAGGWETLIEDDYQYAILNHTQKVDEVIVTSTGYVIEHSSIEDNGQQYIKYMDIWRRVGEKLYIFQDIISADTPYREPTLLEEITARRNEWSYYTNTGNFKSACTRYTPDCCIAPAGMPPVSGRDGCARLRVKKAVSGIATIIEVPQQYEVTDLGGGFVLNHGAMIVYDEAGGELDRVKDMKIWKRLEDGQLYILFEMWNSDIHF